MLSLAAVTIRRKGCKSQNYKLNDREYYFTGAQTHRQNTTTGEQKTVTVGSPDYPMVMRHPHPTATEATTAAKSEWQRITHARAKLTLELAKGRSELFPDTPVKAIGFKG